MEASKSTQHIFSEWTRAVRNSDWHHAEAFLAADVVVNGNSIARHAYTRKLKDDSFNMARLDMLIVDDEMAEIAIRYTFPRSLQSLSQGEEWTEQALFSIVGDKISAVQTIEGANHFSNPISYSESKEDTQTVKIKKADLRKFYTAYIDSINRLTMREHFDEFCQDVVTHNYISYDRDEYRKMIESSFEEISGLRFTVERLIVNEEAQQVAARLGFTGEHFEESRLQERA